MEWLKDILGEELYSQVSVKLTEKNIKIANLSDGSYLPRDKFNEKNNENKLLKEQIEEFKKKSAEVDKLVSSNQELKSQLDTLNNDFSTKLTAKDNEILSIAKKSAISKVLMENKAVYPDLLMNSLKIDEVQLDGENLKNFDIESVKKQYPNMFEAVQVTGNVNPGNNNPLTSNTSNLSKKQQLIQEYEKTQDVTRRYLLREQINNLNE